MVSKRKPITEIQQAAADKLLYAWEERKKQWKAEKREEKFPSREDVSILLGWSNSMLGQYLRGDVALNLTALTKICNFMETDPVNIYPELFEGPFVTKTPVTNPDAENKVTSDLRPVAESPRQIPVISTVQAGDPKEVIDTYEKGDGFETINVDEETAKELGPYAFALVVEGESMLPEFSPGDKVIVDSDVSPRPGSIVVAKMKRDDATTIKKYRPRGIDGSGHEEFELVPLNEDWPNIYVDADNPGRIVGVVVEHRRKLR